MGGPSDDSAGGRHERQGKWVLQREGSQRGGMRAKEDARKSRRLENRREDSVVVVVIVG